MCPCVSLPYNGTSPNEARRRHLLGGAAQALAAQKALRPPPVPPAERRELACPSAACDTQRGLAVGSGGKGFVTALAPIPRCQLPCKGTGARTGAQPQSGPGVGVTARGALQHALGESPTRAPECLLGRATPESCSVSLGRQGVCGQGRGTAASPFPTARGKWQRESHRCDGGGRGPGGGAPGAVPGLPPLKTQLEPQYPHP